MGQTVDDKKENQAQYQALLGDLGRKKPTAAGMPFSGTFLAVGHK